MLDRLPPEALQLVIRHLMILCCESSIRKKYCPPLEEKSYKSFRSWTCLIEHEHILNLAHTNKHLKAIVYSHLFENISLAAATLQEHMDAVRMFFRRRESAPDAKNMALTTPDVLRFDMALDRKKFSKDALHHVKCLHVSSSYYSYEPWFAGIVDSTSCLQEITFYFSFMSEPENTAYILDTMAKHKNRPRVHVSLSFASDIIQLPNLFKYFENEWSSFQKLNIESLFLSYDHKDYRFPDSFFAIIKQLTTLKRLQVVCHNDNERLRLVKSSHPHRLGMDHILTLLKDLPVLQDLEIAMPSQRFTWPKLSNITRLHVPLWAFKSKTIVEMF